MDFFPIDWFEDQQTATLLQCLVCFQVPRVPSVTKCGHSFCSFCITNWLILNDSCPNCRQITPEPRQDMLARRLVVQLKPSRKRKFELGFECIMCKTNVSDQPQIEHWFGCPSNIMYQHEQKHVQKKKQFTEESEFVEIQLSIDEVGTIEKKKSDSVSIGKNVSLDIEHTNDWIRVGALVERLPCQILVSYLTPESVPTLDDSRLMMTRSEFHTQSFSRRRLLQYMSSKRMLSITFRAYYRSILPEAVK